MILKEGVAWATQARFKCSLSRYVSNSLCVGQTFVCQTYMNITVNKWFLKSSHQAKETM